MRLVKILPFLLCSFTSPPIVNASSDTEYDALALASMGRDHIEATKAALENLKLHGTVPEDLLPPGSSYDPIAAIQESSRVEHLLTVMEAFVNDHIGDYEALELLRQYESNMGERLQPNDWQAHHDQDDSEKQDDDPENQGEIPFTYLDAQVATIWSSNRKNKKVEASILVNHFLSEQTLEALLHAKEPIKVISDDIGRVEGSYIHKFGPLKQMAPKSSEASTVSDGVTEK